MSEHSATAVEQPTAPAAAGPPTVPVAPAALVARGFALFPLRPGSKLPAVARDWEHAATTSLVRLRQLGSDPRANYGVACGPSNLVVIDLDVAKEAEPGEPTEGLEVLRELAGERGLPRTFTVGTPSGGRHLYFRPPVDGSAPRNTVRRLGPLIDTRGAGGYVVAPGSRVDGVTYRILDDAPIAQLPEWIAALLRPIEARPAPGEPLPLATALGPVGARLGGAYARSALERELARVESARVGTRNDTLNRAAYSLGTLIGGGLLDQALVETELTRAALAAGLDARETASTLRSGLTAGIARPRRPATASAAAAGAGIGAGPSPGPGQASLFGVEPTAAASRALIPTLMPPPADWPRVFGVFEGLGAAAAALRQELSASVPDFALPQTPPPPSVPEPTAAALVARLAELDAAYDRAAAASGPLGGSARWLGVQALEDLLRDLREELAEAASSARESEPGALPEQAFALVRALTTAAARRIVALVKEIAIKLGADGLRRSPLAASLHRMQRAAEAVAAFGAPAAALTPTRFATGRGALQAQLAAMRRELQNAGRAPAVPGAADHG